MSINEHIEKVFGQNNYNEKRESYNQEIFQKKSIKINNPKTDKKLSIRKNINFNNINNENISTLSNKSNQGLKLIPFVEQNNDNSFYSKFMKKIKEEEENNKNNHNKNNLNSKTIQKKKNNIKPSFLKKEKSEANFHSKNYLDKKKDISSFFKRDNSILSIELKGNQTPNNRMKLNFNKNFNLDYNEKKSCKTLFKKENEIGHVRTQNLFSSVNNYLNNNNKLSLNQKQLNKNKNIGFNIEDEVIQDAIQLEIINNFKEFKVLKIETKVTCDQIIKNVDFSNVKKLNLQFKNKNSNNNDIKNTNVNNNDETKYKVPNNVLTQKKNSIFCCF